MPQLDFSSNGIGFCPYNMVGQKEWWTGLGSNQYLKIFSLMYTPSIRPVQKKW